MVRSVRPWKLPWKQMMSLRPVWARAILMAFSTASAPVVTNRLFLSPEIGAMAPDPGNVSASVYEWLTTQAHDRRITVHRDNSLQRIVFEDGAVLGAVFTTLDGPLAIRARRGVHVSTGGPQINTTAQYQLPAGETTLRVCLVGQAASRFGRVELVTSEPFRQSATPSCRAVNRQLHVSLHETQTHSHVWRCGKVDGYPPSGK